MKIAFRVDSADSIGAGHIRRCLKLAEDLKNKSKKIYFITKNLTGNFNKLIDKKKFKVILIKNDTSKKRIISDWNSTKHICKKFKINVLIADHYQLGINWEKKIKKCVNKLVVIDDFSKKEHYCDLIINNFSKKKNNYAKYYNGLEYVIIPSQILRQKTNNKTKSKFKKIGTFFGSSDSRNITETIDWVDKMNGYGREVQKDFLLFTLDMFRQSFIGHYSGESLLSLSKEQKQFLSKFSSFIHHKNITEFHQEINKAYYHLERNANAKVLFLDVSLKIYSLLKRSSVDS